MSGSKTYLQSELGEKIPQKIISHFQMTKNIGKNEQVLAVMGATQFMGITSSVVSTRDRLVYLNNSGIAPKLFLIPYADIESVALNPEKNKEYITVTKKNGDTIKLSIDAAVDDTKKFFDFLVGYKDQGAKEAISDFEKATFDNKIENKKAQREKEYQREMEKIKQEMTPEAKAKRIQDIKEKQDAKLQEFKEKQNAKLQKTKEQLAEVQKEIEKNKQELTPEAKAKRAKEINEKIDEEQRQSRLKTAKENEKISAELDATTIKRNRAGFNLDYCSGLGGNAVPGPVHVEENGFEQYFELTFSNRYSMRIPFANIKGSSVHTDVPVHEIDFDNKYTYFLNVECEVGGHTGTIVFSHTHKKLISYDPVRLLNVTIQHLPEKIAAYKERNAGYDERERQLAEQRAELIKKRDQTLNDMHGLFGQQSSETINATNVENVELTDTISAAKPASDPFNEIKKFKDLLDQGIITQEEFDVKKKQLLGL